MLRGGRPALRRRRSGGCAVPPSRQCRRAAGPSMSEKKQPVDLGLLEEDDEFEEFPAEGAERAERGGWRKRSGGGRAVCRPRRLPAGRAGPGRGESAACGGRGRAVLCRATESPAGIWPCPLPQRPASPGPHCPVRAGSGRKGCAARRCCVIVRER